MPVSLDPALPQTTRQLSESEQAQINKFVETLCDMIQKHDSVGWEKARDALKVQLVRPAGAVFQAAYSLKLANEINKRWAELDAVAKLNFAIIASELRDPSAVGPFKQMLQDDLPAVRYWVGAGIGNIMANLENGLPLGEQADLFEVLQSQLKKDHPQDVYDKLLFALASLTHPNAMNHAWTVFGSRASVHLEDPELRVEGERAALQELFKQIVKRVVAGEKVPEGTERNLGIVAYRYLKASTQLWRQGDIPAHLLPEHHRLMLLCESALEWSTKKAGLKPIDKQLKGPAGPLAQNQRALAELIADEWRSLLKQSPISATDAELSLLPAPAGATTSAEGAAE